MTVTAQPLVVDASVWVSVFVPLDGFHAASAGWIAAQQEAGRLLLAPALLLPEVAGSVARRIGPASGRAAMVWLAQAPVLRLLRLERTLAREIARIAADLRLRGSDACYVAVAQRHGVPPVTWDDEQRQRAGAVTLDEVP